MKLPNNSKKNTKCNAAHDREPADLISSATKYCVLQDILVLSSYTDRGNLICPIKKKATVSSSSLSSLKPEEKRSTKRTIILSIELQSTQGRIGE
jgi:hypothetical protein